MRDYGRSALRERLDAAPVEGDAELEERVLRVLGHRTGKRDNGLDENRLELQSTQNTTDTR